jgi:hypothetical protein
MVQDHPFPLALTVFLLLADQLHGALMALGVFAVFPGNTVNLDVVVVNVANPPFVHVLVFGGVQVGSAGELEVDLFRRGLRIGLRRG